MVLSRPGLPRPPSSDNRFTHTYACTAIALAGCWASPESLVVDLSEVLPVPLRRPRVYARAH
eukprot:12386773-Alexandrium_andersonii.AAC.1